MACSEGGIRQKLGLSDCLTHVETSSITFWLTVKKEDGNNFLNIMLWGSLSAWDQKRCSWLLVGWPQWLSFVGSLAWAWLLQHHPSGLGQAGRNPSEPFVLDFTHPCEWNENYSFFHFLNEIICKILTFGFQLRLKGVTVYLGLKK